MDRALLARLVEAEQVQDAAEPTLDDVVDAMRPYDESAMPDPFAEIPRGMG